MKFTKYMLMEEANPAGGGGGTGATGGTGTPPPAAFPENWKDLLPDDIKADPNLSVINDIPNLAKSFIHAQKGIGAGKVAIPGKHATDADWDHFYRQVGLPEKPDDYLADVPKEKQTDFFKGFKELAHKAGVLPHQGKKMLEWYEGIVAKEAEDYKKQHQARMDEADKALKLEYGQAYEQKLNLATQVVKDLSEKIGDDGKFVKFLEETELGSRPEMIKMLVHVAEMIGEDKFEGGGSKGAMTPAEAKQKISAIMGDMKGPYYDAKHPGHKAAVQEVNDLTRFTV
jgi:hypothetical protein